MNHDIEKGIDNFDLNYNRAMRMISLITVKEIEGDRDWWGSEMSNLESEMIKCIR